VKELVTYLVRSLAGRPDDVVVTETVQDKGTVLELTVADEDLNHLIGKQGRTVKAMRTLLAAAGAKNGGRYSLKIAAAGSTGGSGEDEASPAVSETDEDHG